MDPFLETIYYTDPAFGTRGNGDNGPAGGGVTSEWQYTNSGTQFEIDGSTPTSTSVTTDDAQDMFTQGFNRAVATYIAESDAHAFAVDHVITGADPVANQELISGVEALYYEYNVLTPRDNMETTAGDVMSALAVKSQFMHTYWVIDSTDNSQMYPGGAGRMVTQAGTDYALELIRIP